MFLKNLILVINGFFSEFYEELQSSRYFQDCETRWMKRIWQKNMKCWYNLNVYGQGTKILEFNFMDE